MAKRICNQANAPHDRTCQGRAIYHVWPPEVLSGPPEGPGLYCCEEHFEATKARYPQGCYVTNLLTGSVDWHAATRLSPAEEGKAAGRAEARAARRADFVERRQRMAITRDKLVQHIAKVCEELQDLAGAAELQAMDNENDGGLGDAWEQVDFALEVAVPKLRLAQEVLQQANKAEAPKVSR